MPIPTEPGWYWGKCDGYWVVEPLHVTRQAGELGFTRLCHKSNEWVAVRYSLSQAEWGPRIPSAERLATWWEKKR